MSTFVLVHGAMHGGWCWRNVAPLLRDAGHTAYAPTLTGQGERSHLLSRDIGVDTHVQDIAALLKYEDLSEVRLVLHSYSGVLAGPIIDAAADRVAEIIYLAAFVVRPGECLLDVEPTETARRYRSLVAETGDGWRLPATDRFLDQWGITDRQLKAWVAPRLTDFPFRCQTDSLDFDAARLEAVPTRYVRHTAPPLASLDLSHHRAVQAGWQVDEIPCGHDTMLAAPHDTARVLVSSASS